MPPIRRKPPEKPVDNKKAIKNILSLLKDYKWNNSSLNNLKNNEWIIKLNNLLS